ncbi:EthD family reductase [Paramyrothecium foliicola]|nr:EthD family reductase [Paramyrothecium foliicola]
METAASHPAVILVLLARKSGTTREDFRNYYETHHVPLVSKLLFHGPLAPVNYTRNYIGHQVSEGLSGESAGSWQHDCVTVTTCKDGAHRDALFAEFTKHSSVIAEDEENFIDRSKTVIILPEPSLGGYPVEH